MTATAADPERHPAQALTRTRRWARAWRAHWIGPAALLGALALGAALAPWEAGMAAGLAASALIAWQSLLLQRRRSELELIGQLLQCINPHLGLQHSLDRMLALTQRHFGASHCSLDGPAQAGPGSAVNRAEPADGWQCLSVSLEWQQSQVHLQLLSRRPWRQRDRRALARIARLAYAPLERLAQLEQVSAQLAERERQRLGLDLHDRVIQPYIGLKLALEALQARPGKSLAAGLQSIVAMTEQVIDGLRGDLRRLEPGLASRAGPPGEPACGPAGPAGADPSCNWTGKLSDDLAEQTQLMARLHGVRITVRGPIPQGISRRLRQEVSQLIREGLSNIRRHTHARSGEVELRCDDRWLGLRISNEGLAAPGDFTPRSISRRSQALGGWTQVRSEAGGRTAVHVTIPL